MRATLLSLPLLVFPLLAAPAWADSGRAADPARTKAITADLSSCPKPVWPQESLRREETGAVILAFLIGLDGTVLESKVDKSSGHPLLDLAARDGLQKCRFTPPAQVGRSVPQWTRMQYVWTLAPDSPEQKAAERAKILADAETGKPDAQFKAAGLHLNAEPKDREQGMALLRKAADQGHARAQEYLAYLLMASDPAEAESWERKAAEQGGASAQFGLAMLMLRQDMPNEYRDWLSKSVAQDFAPAQTQMARTLLQEADVEGAVSLLQAAAAKQERGAQFLLGQCYEKGQGVPQDSSKALELYQRAAAGGVTPAQAALVRLRSAQ